MLSSAEKTISIENLSHQYKSRIALRSIDLQVAKGEILGILGPNGGGKTTLFRILSTLLTPSEGRALICGHDVVRESSKVRKEIGVVFQSASLDDKLTVAENLRYHGYLYGLSSRILSGKIEELLRAFGLSGRASERAETLSGGLKRRVELAKALLPDPSVLILDEPTTGLDPLARAEFWTQLKSAHKNHSVTVLLATHLLDDAEKCTRLSLLHQGAIVADDSPQSLKEQVKGETVSIETDELAALARLLQTEFNLKSDLVGEQLRIEVEDAHHLVSTLMERFKPLIRSVKVSQPTLEDVFIHLTGRKLED
ncbi:MAG: ABC transporter ATP-binding protein [Deltaproteobacteria bacterium]|nr:ABC transporter ATP-binding protein [Deltaproteobacteria bacterium]